MNRFIERFESYLDDTGIHQVITESIDVSDLNPNIVKRKVERLNKLESNGNIQWKVIER